MPGLLWTSVLLGVALGAANIAASLLLVRVARGRPQATFFVIVFGGMFARMTLLLTAFAAVIAWAPVHRMGFVGGLGAALIVGLAAEVLLLLRRHPRVA